MKSLYNHVVLNCGFSVFHHFCVRGFWAGLSVTGCQFLSVITLTERNKVDSQEGQCPPTNLALVAQTCTAGQVE